MGRGERLVNRLVRRQQDNPLRLGLRNLYILPTGFGWLWLSGAALLLIVAIQTQQNGPLLLSYWMLGLMLLALHLTHFNLQGLELECAASAAAFAGRPAGYALSLRSRLPRDNIQLNWLEADREEGLWLSIGRTEQVVVLPWTPRRRGWQSPGRLRLHSSTPLGLFHCWTLWDPPRPQLIYPRRRPGPVMERPAAATKPNPEWTPLQRGDGDSEWHDLRPHRPEDGPRRLAWKQLAQGRGRLSKQFSASSTEPLLLAPAAGVPRQEALEHLCERIWRLSQQEACYGLELDGSRIAPGSGAAHRDRCLQALATAP
jgi:uncharacterized protein (DUF58 family)